MTTTLISDLKKVYDKVERPWHLRLADEREWELTADEPLRPWLEAFAGILRLKRAEQSGAGPCLSFRSKQDLRTSPGSCYDLGPVTFRKEDDSQDWLCSFSFPRGRKQDIEYMYHALMVVYRDALDRGGFPCHGGLLSWHGRGILIAGASGTGKSTICRRLLSTGSVLCDEETLVVRDGQGRYWGHPFPTWSRLFESPEPQSWTVQHSIPLDGIFFVIPAGKGQCIPVGPGEAAACLTSMALDKALRGWGSLQGEALIELKKQVFANVCSLVSNVPAARLYVSMAGDMEQEFAESCERLWKRKP